MSQNLVVIDYGAGNLRSGAKAFICAAERAGLDVTVTVTDDPKAVASADRLVLPGVGAFGDCLRGLNARAGLREALSEAVLHAKKPFFGICVGMQLLADMGHEHGENNGLGWVGGHVRKLDVAPDMKIPHMGWNTLSLTGTGLLHSILKGISADAQVYFVHSYAFGVANSDHILATTDYGQPITAAIGFENIFATQFHPEKSQLVGLRIIENFLTWTP